MKADACGTYTEQIRARMGWKSPSQIKALVTVPETRCSGCRYFHRKRIDKRDGGVDFSPYCCHPMAGGGNSGHATRETALCNRWERAES